MTNNRVKLLLELNAITRSLGDGDLSKLLKFASAIAQQKQAKKRDRTNSREKRKPPIIKASETLWS